MSSEKDLDKLTEELFGAGRAERPSPELKDRMLEELLTKGRVQPVSKPFRWRRWSGLGGLLLALLLAWFAFRPEAPPPLIASEVEPPLTPIKVAPLTPSGVEGLPPAPVIVEPVPVPATAPVPVPVPVPKKPPPPVLDDGDGLARELALLDQARRVLATSPAETLRVLDTHRRQFPAGSLRVEADLIRVEALVKLGRRAEAVTLGAKLTAGDPEGPIGLRVKRVLGDEGAP